MMRLLTACAALLVGGCSCKIVSESEMYFLRHDVSELRRDVLLLNREVRDISRGYKIVPIKVIITNLSETAEGGI